MKGARLTLTAFLRWNTGKSSSVSVMLGWQISYNRMLFD